MLSCELWMAGYERPCRKSGDFDNFLEKLLLHMIPDEKHGISCRLVQGLDHTECFRHRRSFILSVTDMASLMAVMGSRFAIDTRVPGIWAVVMLIAYQAFYTWDSISGI